MKTAILITMALSTMAYADPLYVYERDPNKLSAIHHGFAVGSNNKVPVLIDIYGRDSIQAAREYGRDLVRHHYPFTESKALIRSKAEQLYKEHASLVRWFEQDAAAGYDEEVRKSRP